jgi:hypothetical protein
MKAAHESQSTLISSDTGRVSAATTAKPGACARFIRGCFGPRIMEEIWRIPFAGLNAPD